MVTGEEEEEEGRGPVGDGGGREGTHPMREKHTMAVGSHIYLLRDVYSGTSPINRTLL